jgi:TPR repeat protein
MNSQKSAIINLGWTRHLDLFRDWQIRARTWLRAEFEEARFYHIRHRAENGDALNQYRMGLICETGGRVARSDYDAHKWFLRAAFQGVVEAQARVSEYYRVGRGQPRNDEEAFKWCRKAAEQGYQPAQFQLAQMYLEGVGVERNLNEARKWQKRSLPANLPAAERILSADLSPAESVS